MTDKVMGGWSYTYDDMNRLTSGTASAGVDVGLVLGWTYDRYGNRWAQNVTGTGNASAVSPQLSFTGNNNRIDGWLYDAACNLLYDYIHHYTYDAENRVATLDGVPTYLYDAEGTRVAKYGSGGALTASYVLGLGGEQVSEVNGAGVWAHSNVFVGGRLMATYEGPGGTAHLGYHYHLTDWLGTQRMQTNAGGNQEEVCYSYPFGDGLNCTGSADATEHHFTGKERDTESGLDYFGARYLSSNLGRFMTPDWYDGPTEVPYANLGDPQSLNLYAYVHNDPNSGIDMDGHCGGVANTAANAQCGQGYWQNVFYGMAAGQIAASVASWNSLPDVEQNAIPGGLITWEDMYPSDQAYVAGQMDAFLEASSFVHIEVGQRSLKAWHGLLGLAGHSYIKDDRGGHQDEVLGDNGKGGGTQANQQVRDTFGTDRQSHGIEVNEWLTPQQYATLTSQAAYFLTHDCPSCGANYKLTSYNSNTFVFNMLSQNPAGSTRPPAASYVAPGYSQQGGAWYGH